MADIPKIRFKGFTEAWEQRKLGEVLKERTERAKGDEELLSVTIANGVIRQIDSEKRNTASEDRSNYKIVKKGDVPYNSMRMWQGAVGNSKYNGIVSPAYTILTPTSEANGKFFMELFKKKSTLQIFQRWSQGLTSDTWNLKYPILSSIQFAIPSVEEQEKIAEYFSSLDYLITLHQRKCDDTKELKKYMLQKMFPKNGEKFPEIRFKGFTEAWEQRKLEDFGKATGGTSIESEFSEDGVYKVISIGSYSENSVYNDQGIRAIKSDKTSNRVLNRNDLTMILNDKTTSGNIIGRVLLIEESGIYVYNQRTERIEINLDEYDPVFLYEMLNAPNIREKIIKQAQGNTQIYVNWTTISLLEYMIPSKEEQVKIGEHLYGISNLIALHQRKCDTLKELKKYMLQNMFPKKG